MSARTRSRTSPGLEAAHCIRRLARQPQQVVPSPGPTLTPGACPCTHTPAPGSAACNFRLIGRIRQAVIIGEENNFIPLRQPVAAR